MAAPVFDAVSSAVGSGAGPYTWSHTCSGSNRVLFVKVSYYDSADSVSVVTYNGVAMTAMSGSLVSNGQYSVVWYYLINPATGSNTVSVSVTGSVFDFGGSAVSVTGADQTTAFGGVTTATGTSTTPSVNVSSASDELVIDGLSIVHSGTLSVGAGQTQRTNEICGSGFIKHATSTEGGGATITMSWSNSSSQAWAISAFAAKPVSATFNVAWAAIANVVLGTGRR